MSEQVVSPRIRGFIATNAHPDGCAENVRRQAEVARTLEGTTNRYHNVLVIGSSTGYGLASLLSASVGLGANVLGVCFERESTEDRTGSAGWYNLAEAHRLAREEGRLLRTINGDAFSHAVKGQAIAALQAEFGPLDLIVYSLAAPRRQDADSDTVWSSVLKPIGAPYAGKTIDLRNDAVVETTIDAATDEEIEATVKVMGGEDWAAWVRALADAGLLAAGCRTVAYSYIGPEVTYPIYRSGTIGTAKEHLEATAASLDTLLSARCGGAAWVSINKAVVTQASAAIPAVALYMSIAFKLMKQRGTHEGTIEQIVRLFRDRLNLEAPPVDEKGRIRLDDWEMQPDLQAEIAGIWEAITTDTLTEVSDYAGYKRDFEQLFGFSVPVVDYAAPTEVHRALE
ncbi:MAG: trans-2-enoyl-CoA reductase family protein [Dehalococcoidia bacterium]